jgi:serine protein kinase
MDIKKEAKKETAIRGQGRMSFQEYVDLVQKSPEVARSAHRRVYDMIMSKGTETVKLYGEDVTVYKFFSSDLFGLERPIEDIVKYFAAAAMGLDIRRRILLLVGPPASAKSTILTLLKRGYEEYTRSDAGAMYGLVGCPHYEEPLNAIPQRLRGDLPVKVEGTLCPLCHMRLDEEFGGDFSRFEVERVIADEASRVAIGTFAPGEPIDQTAEDLVGSLDLSKISIYGSESDPRAFRFDGGANVASRGIFEVNEALKAKPELLHIFLTLAQERMVKAKRFPLFFLDEVLIMHTNEAEFSRFASDRKNEAIQNRIYVVKVPYNLRLSEEVRIYEKMVNESYLRTHIAPHTFEAASRWGLLTRIEPTSTYNAVAKLKIYNQEYFGDFTHNDIYVIREISGTDGMFGVSPRQIINAISQASASTSEGCINAVDVLHGIRNTLDSHIQSDPRLDDQTLSEAIKSATEEYLSEVTKEIQKAFIQSFESVAQTVLENYLDNAQHSVDKSKLRDPITGEYKDADEELLRSLEEQIGVTSNQALDFRREVLMRVGDLLRRGGEFRWDSHPRLKEAIEKKLFSDLSATIKMTVNSRYADRETKKRLTDVMEVLKDQGYCEVCAKKTLDFVGEMLNR